MVGFRIDGGDLPDESADHVRSEGGLYLNSRGGLGMRREVNSYRDRLRSRLGGGDRDSGNFGARLRRRAVILITINNSGGGGGGGGGRKETVAAGGGLHFEEKGKKARKESEVAECRRF